MSMPLAEALEQVDLDVGGTYCCRVKGRWVEVRVLQGEPAGLAKSFKESDVLLDPWFELPGIGAVKHCPARSGIDLPFDVPNIPSDWAGV